MITFWQSKSIFSYYTVLTAKKAPLSFIFQTNLLTPNNFHGWFQVNHEIHGYRTRLNLNVNYGNHNKEFICNICKNN